MRFARHLAAGIGFAANLSRKIGGAIDELHPVRRGRAGVIGGIRRKRFAAARHLWTLRESAPSGRQRRDRWFGRNPAATRRFPRRREPNRIPWACARSFRRSARPCRQPDTGLRASRPGVIRTTIRHTSSDFGPPPILYRRSLGRINRGQARGGHATCRCQCRHPAPEIAPIMRPPRFLALQGGGDHQPGDRQQVLQLPAGPVVELRGST